MPDLCEGTSGLTSAARDCTSEPWENYFDSRLIRRFVANHRDGRVPTRNSAGVRKISAHVPAHAAKSCHPRSPSGRLPV